MKIKVKFEAKIKMKQKLKEVEKQRESFFSPPHFGQNNVETNRTNEPASEKLYSFLVVEIKEGRVLQEFFAYATKSRKFTLCPPPPFIMGVTIPLNED